MCAAKMTSDREGTITITPKTHSAVVVFLHGLGDTAHGWAETMGTLSSHLPHVKFVLPTASDKPVTVNMGRRMPSWYDIKAVGRTNVDEVDGIEDSHDVVLGLIDKEVEAGIPHSRIVLGGFSQGGSMSYFTGFQMKAALAGVLVLSGRIPRLQSFAVTPEAKSVPTLICHGDADPVVPLQRSLASVEKLQSEGVNPDFRVYSGMRHSTCMEELADIRYWLQKVLPAS